MNKKLIREIVEANLTEALSLKEEDAKIICEGTPHYNEKMRKCADSSDEEILKMLANNEI